ncbi:hypothetical protein FQR65_LT18352 [Abscondita terminalis]|nr:hypothetical protein FQR65_LT18352 [Abscondita terminalis]
MPKKDILVIDLSIPNNVDKTVADVDGVELIDVDALSVQIPRPNTTPETHGPPQRELNSHLINNATFLQFKPKLLHLHERRNYPSSAFDFAEKIVYETIQLGIAASGIPDYENDIHLLLFQSFRPWNDPNAIVLEGKGSRLLIIAKSFLLQQPEAAHQLLQKITDTTIAYLKRKVEKGVSAVQVFDSWGGMLSPADYQEFSWKYINQIVEALSPLTEVVVFAKGCWYALEDMAKSKASALGVDWTVTPEIARKLTGGNMTLQGNFDPARLHSSPETIRKMVHEMIDRFGKDKYIANLGHGILPNIPVENAEAFIRAVVEYKA